MRLIKFILLSCTVFCGAIATAQTYVSPLDIPMSLSANFGEIRANHFHSGIDFKTQGVCGKPIHSVANGYVSRIFISLGGYGRALYVTHPEHGTLSVYGHCEAFAPELERYIVEQQYAKQKFEQDIYLQPNLFTVKAGQLIAYSGNSGSSGGPHLHFEIREGVGARPVNILARKIYKVEDTIKPSLFSVALFEIDTVMGVPHHREACRYGVTRAEDGSLHLKADTIPISKNSYFVFEVTDRKNGVNNTFGIYKLDVARSGQPFFGFAIDNFSFGETRFINTLCSAEAKSGARNDFIRTFISPYNTLSIYSDVQAQGVVMASSMSLGLVEPMSVSVEDDSGNSVFLQFNIKRVKADTTPVALNVEGTPMWWLTGGRYSNTYCSVVFPAKSLYESAIVDIKVDTISALGRKYPVVSVGSDAIMLQKSYSLKLFSNKVSDKLRSKALIARVGPQGRLSSEGGAWESGGVEVKIGSTGRFTIAIDTIKPKLEPMFKEAEKISSDILRFKGSDELSGIASYTAKIDGNWVLMEYEPKQNLFFCRLNLSKTKRSEKHSVEFTLTDKKGNSKTLKNSFLW